MTDPKADDTAPVAPRRPLSGPAQAAGPATVQAPAPAPGPAPSNWRPRARRRGRAQAVKPPQADERPAQPEAPPRPPPEAPPRPPPQPPRHQGERRAPGQQVPRPATAVPRPQPPAQPQPQPRPQPQPKAVPERPAQVRRARLRVVRVDPWSVMKMAFALSIALAIVMVVAVALVWTVLDAAGVWDSINSSVAAIFDDGSSFDVTNYVGLPRVMGLTMIVAVADVILITAIATLGAFLYNLSAALLGGLEVTLAETR